MEGWRQGIIYHYLQASVNKNFIEFSHCCSRITGSVGLAEYVYLSTMTGAAALWLLSKASGAQSSNRAWLPVPSLSPQ